jgi:acetoin utilization protein AcuB
MRNTVGDIMNRQTVCIDKNASLKEITGIVTSEGYSHIPVLDQNVLVGIVSKTDLVLRFMEMLNETSGKHYTSMLMNHLEVETIMHRNPITLKASDDLAYATELLLQRQFHGLVVVNDQGNVVGIVTAFDVLKAMAETK